MTFPIANPAAGASAGDPADLPFPSAPIEELLRLFVKAIRAHQLYLPNNPIYKGAVDSVRAAFAPVWQQTDEFALTFAETEIKWLGKTVHAEASKGADSLPWTFYKDGIREVTFVKGFEEEELLKLFDILQTVRKASPDVDDLLTLLWTADFGLLRYRYVDLGAEPTPALADGGEPMEPAAPGEVRAAAHAETSESQSGVVNMQDFDSTLYFLDEKELDYLRLEIEREYASDLRQNVTAMLLDIYEAQPTDAIRAEVAEIVEYLMLALLSNGQLRTVSYLLAETQIAVERGQQVTPEQKAQFGRLPDRLSAAEPLGQLLQALDETADHPPQGELVDLFLQLRAVALDTIFAWLPRLQNESIRKLVEAAADRLASGNTSELVRLVLSPNKVIAKEAIRRSGTMKTTAAVAPIARVLVDGDVELRQMAVQALTNIGSPGALQALERCIEDSDREVRVNAVRILGAKAFRGVFPRLDSVVRGKGLRDADLTERMAFFEAYGALCGDNGVEFLDGLLNGKGMFGKREDPELRACAAMALGRVGTKKAQDALQRATAEKDVVVRNAVSRAMRGGPA